MQPAGAAQGVPRLLLLCAGSGSAGVLVATRVLKQSKRRRGSGLAPVASLTSTLAAPAALVNAPSAASVRCRPGGRGARLHADVRCAAARAAPSPAKSWGAARGRFCTRSLPSSRRSRRSSSSATRTSWYTPAALSMRQARRAPSSSALACTQIMVLTRLYPCRECATHFAELVRREQPRRHSCLCCV